MKGFKHTLKLKIQVNPRFSYILLYTFQSETNTRKSTRLSKKETVNYKELNQGKKLIINAGSSEVASYMQKYDH